MAEDDATEALAIVGTRSGSRGVPDKNARPLAGHPLVAWILDAARASSRVTRVVVSTDSERYARIAREHGAETPVLRPPSVTGPDAIDVEFIIHMLDYLETKR